MSSVLGDVQKGVLGLFDDPSDADLIIEAWENSLDHVGDVDQGAQNPECLGTAISGADIGEDGSTKTDPTGPGSSEIRGVGCQNGQNDELLDSMMEMLACFQEICSNGWVNGESGGEEVKDGMLSETVIRFDQQLSRAIEAMLGQLQSKKSVGGLEEQSDLGNSPIENGSADGKSVRKFHVHRLILKTVSPNFCSEIEDMAVDSMKCLASGTKIRIAKLELDSQVVETFLKHVYGAPVAQIGYDFELAVEVLKMAHGFKTQFIVDLAAHEAFKFVSKENIFQLVELGFLFGIPKLQTEVVEWIMSVGSDEGRLLDIIPSVNPGAWKVLKEQYPGVAVALWDSYSEQASKKNLRGKCDECKEIAFHLLCEEHYCDTTCYCEECDQYAVVSLCNKHLKSKYTKR